MKNLRLLTTLALFAVSYLTNAQTTVCLGTDATLCVGSAVQIQDCNPGTVSGTLMDNPTFVTLSDDSYSPAVPIGFNFEFYGNNHTQCVIGSNGVISFDLTNANGYCPWALGGVAPLPNNAFADAMNAQMPAYHDINPNVGTSPQGEILYQTVGTAPNRRFIILYKDIYAFGGGGECTYMAVIMNETANSFEFHLGYKPIAAGWNGGLAIQGSQDPTGTIAHITPGRNVSQWSATNEAKIWTPDAPNATMNYTITNIPYEQVVSPNSTFAWANTLGQTFPYNNGVIDVNPVLPGSVGYFLTLAAQSCSNNISGTSDTTWITGTSSGVTASMTNDTCSAGIGTVTATPTMGTPPYVFNWPGLGNNPNQTVTGVFAGTYTVEMTDANGCPSTANVTVGDTPATFSGATTQVSCPGGNDGTATATMSPMIGNITYQWDANAGNQTTQTATGLAAGTYDCVITSDVGCFETVTVTVTEIPGMIGVIVNQTDVTCHAGNDGVVEVTVSQGTPPYSYAWDNSTSVTNSATDLAVGNHVVTITDANGCVITIPTTLNEPAALDISFITPDTQICPEDDILLTATGTGGSSPYTFTWYENGTPIATGDNITVDPINTNTQYCVELTEACGSPIDSECTLIYFPTPIQPSAVPDEVEKCEPAWFAFENTSTNGGEIATTYWDFGSTDLAILEQGADSTSMTFDIVGTYDLIMTTTSIYGCVYVDTVFDIIEVKAIPTAEFNISTNPATVFETTVFMQDQSSPDVVNWTWYSPGSNPVSSTQENPVLVFPEGEIGEYPITLYVENELGCSDSVKYLFNVTQDILFYAPNSFTPDGDEFNQTWKPEISGIDIYDFDLYIFNRWGEMIWENHDPSVGWDGTYNGKLVPTGTYIWTSRVSDLFTDEKVEYNGSINVLR